MQVTICDGCKTILEEKEIHFVSTYFGRGFELCEECRKKFNKIKEEYYKQDDDLEKQREILFDKFKEKLKNIGLNY